MSEKWDLERERAFKKNPERSVGVRLESGQRNVRKGMEGKNPQRIREGKKVIRELAQEGVIPDDEGLAVEQMIEGVAQLVEKGEIFAAHELAAFTGIIIYRELTHIPLNFRR